MKLKLLLILLTITTITFAQSRRIPIGTSNARNQMLGLWEYSITPTPYTIGDSLRIVYYKQLQTALDGKENTLPTGTTNQYIRGNKTLGTFQNGNGITWDGTRFNLGGALTGALDIGGMGQTDWVMLGGGSFMAFRHFNGFNPFAISAIELHNDSARIEYISSGYPTPPESARRYVSISNQRIYFQGNSRFSVLQGTGVRMVTASADGSLSTQAIPSGGSGSTVTGLTYNRTNRTITLNQTSGGSQAVSLNDTSYVIENAPFAAGSNNLLVGVNDSTSRVRRIRFNGADTTGSTSDLLNVTITGGGAAVWGGITGTLASQSDLNSALNGKQATLIAGSNIKTINGQSILGAGDLAIGGGGANDTLKVQFPLFMSNDTLKIDTTGLGGGGGGSSAFNAITSGTNTTATMTVGSGATLNRSGTGIIDANRIQGFVVNGGWTPGQIMQYDNNGQFSPASFNLLTVMASGNSTNIQMNSQGTHGYISGDYDLGQDALDNFRIRKGGSNLFTIKSGRFGFNESDPLAMLTVRAENNTSGTQAVLFKDFFDVNLFDLRADGTGIINKKAWQYNADYSSGYTTRSIPDVGYVQKVVDSLKGSIVLDSINLATTTTSDFLNLDTLTTAAGTVTVYDVNVIASKGNNINSWYFKVTVKNVGGTYSYSRTIEVGTEEDASLDADIAPVSGQIVIGVVSNSGGTVKWTSSTTLKNKHIL